MLEHLIHFLHGGAAAAGDALAALAVDQVGVGALVRGHRVDDGFEWIELLLVDLRVFREIRERADLRQHAHQLLERAHLADLAQLIAKILAA